MSDDWNVIDLDSRRIDSDVPMLKVKRNKNGFCHHQFTIHIETRTVTCKKCGSLIDSFDAIVHISSRWEVYANDLKHRREEAIKLHDELKDLKRQKRNLKASIRRLQKKQGSQ